MPSGDFQQRALKTLAQHVRFDAAMWGAGTLQGRDWSPHHCHLQDLPLEMVADLAAVQKEDLVTQQVIAQLGAVVHANAEELYRGKRNTRMRAIVERYEGRQGLFVAQKDRNTDLVQWISLYRARAERLFSSRDRDLAQAVYPHLFEALTVNRLAQLDQLYLDRDPRRASFAVLDVYGLFHVGDPGFESKMREEWPQWEGGRVPTELSKHLAVSSSFQGNRIIVEGKAVGDLIFLRARTISPWDRLSEREKAISRLYCAGHSHKDVAKALSISPHTVRTHLRTIYRKLGITDKSQLSALCSGAD